MGRDCRAGFHTSQNSHRTRRFILVENLHRHARQLKRTPIDFTFVDFDAVHLDVLGVVFAQMRSRRRLGGSEQPSGLVLAGGES